MPARVSLPAKNFAADDLVHVYRLFCQAYELDCSERDERFLRGWGIGDLRQGHLDYRPFMGAKFIGQRTGNATQFHGYKDLEDLEECVNDARFEALVREYFASRKKE